MMMMMMMMIVRPLEYRESGWNPAAVRPRSVRSAECRLARISDRSASCR